MKFLFDHNLPPHLAYAINALLTPAGHSAAALRDKFGKDSDDIDWITILGKEKDWVVVSQDHFKKRNGLEKEAIRREGITVFCLKPAWASQKFWPKSANLVKWFPRTIDQSEGISGGAAFWVPWRMTSGGKFEQIKL